MGAPNSPQYALFEYSRPRSSYYSYDILGYLMSERGFKVPKEGIFPKLLRVPNVETLNAPMFGYLDAYGFSHGAGTADRGRGRVESWDESRASLTADPRLPGMIVKSLLRGPGQLQPDHNCSYTPQIAWPTQLKGLTSGL